MNNMTFEDYRCSMEGAGPKLKEMILDAAAHNPETISLPDFLRLCELAYPEPV